MKRLYGVSAASISLLVAILAGCSGVFPCDSQKDLPAATNTLVNPQPVERNFLRNNNSHKLLIAVVDTGIDYNHPSLLNNIHFTLDRNSRPVRLGWDFTGLDVWPCPYIGRRTVCTDYELELIDRLIEADSQLGIYLDKKRNVVQEYRAAVWHGTSMAGLIAQGSRKIGLLAYRVVPPSAVSESNYDYTLHIVENILKACQKAIEDDANMIVLTAFFHFDGKEEPNTFIKMRMYSERFENLMSDHPEVLFIAGAGNCDGYRFSGRQCDQIDFPAGMIAENLMVVGSASNEGGISTFSNVPTGDINTVFLLGQEISCIYPSQMLNIPNCYFATLPTLLDDLQDGNESYASIASYLRQLVKNGQIVTDGTSFSTALAANLSARLWIDDDKLMPSDIVKKILKTYNTRQRVIKK